MLKKYRALYHGIILFFLLLLTGGMFRYWSEKHSDTGFPSDHIEKLVHNMRSDLRTLLKTINFDEVLSHQKLWQQIDSLNLKKNDILVFIGNDLLAWTNHLLPIEGINPQYFKNPLVKLDNGWYLADYWQSGDLLVVAFALLKWEYPYQNQFLEDGFPAKFGLDPSILVSRSPAPEYIPINDENGKHLFSLIPFRSKTPPPKTEPISRIFYLLSLITLWIVLHQLQNYYLQHPYSNLIWAGASIFFSFIYYALIWGKKALIPKDSILFSPHHFAMSELLPSLGHFLLFTLLIFIIAFWFFRFYQLPPSFNKRSFSKTRWFLTLIVFLIICSILLIFINQLFYKLAYHSSGPLIITKIIDLDLIALIKILIVALLLLSFLIVLERVIIILLIYYSRKQLFVSFLILTITLILIFGGIGVGDSDWAFLFFIVCSSLLIFLHKRPHMSHSYSNFLLFSGLFAIYAGIIMTDLSIRKEESNRELLIENLSFQLMRDEDPIAEMYLSEIENQISNDATLTRLLTMPEIDPDAIRNHLEKYYFYGYWSRYDLQVIPCWPEGNLYIEETGEIQNCYNYFFQILDNEGYTIANSKHFHYLDNQLGRVSYFGVFRFFPNDPIRETSLFIELYSQVFFEGPGYPELLVSDREYSRLKLMDKYSYAKYLNGHLVKRSGEYLYKNELTHFQEPLYNKTFFKEGDYSHLVYKPANNISIVLSYKDYSLSDVFMAFSIFFMFFFLSGALLILFMQWQTSGFSFIISIQKRIQVAFVALMLVMLIIVATGTVAYTSHQFKQRHLELLENKVQSVLRELEYKVGFDGPETTIPEEYLNYQLQMISNIFHADFNLYNTEGKLIATSRDELFRNGLAGHQMNPTAYHKLAYTDSDNYLAEEQIGNLSYLSFYVPVLDRDNRMLGFANLPYFVGNNELHEEISSVIVTIINFYLIFSFIAIGFAVFMARQITRPLLMLQDKISRINLDKFNEKIDYKGKDEIGNLVTEYNRMVDELAVSAEKLAKTERDLAWREMAKQIAHEIKNPLTPMKLSIQYLRRAWKDQVKDFDDYLKRVTDTLIEQINTLSSIASEFSKFAQLPSEKAKIINLIDKINSSRQLFENYSNISFTFDTGGLDKILVKADSELLSGVFNNLIKNAIQSIPDKKHGRIEIKISINEQKVIIAIKDNGKGIATEIKNKLFVPSFTTKSGGMGLGLAIARKTIENAGGSIWFETEIEKGSVFYVELPIYSESSGPKSST